MAHILTVDDSVSLRRLVAATLVDAGHQVTEASDGNEALESAQRTRFDLIISDVTMPGMDGLTLVRKVRALGTYKGIPILMLTTETDPSMKKRAKEAGATGWISKPFDPEKLLATIRKVIP